MSQVYTQWMHKWIDTQLRPDQQDKKWNQKTSIFNAYVKKTFGGKAFIIAVLQCGSSLMPSGAAEHAQKFRDDTARTIACLEELVDWLDRFGAAYVGHKKDPATQKAREYSWERLWPKWIDSRATTTSVAPAHGSKTSSPSNHIAARSAGVHELGLPRVPLSPRLVPTSPLGTRSDPSAGAR